MFVRLEQCVPKSVIAVRHAQPQTIELALGILQFVAGVAAVSRLGAYLCVHQAVLLPNVSLWARIRTGRLILPAYDCVFLAPAIGVAAVIPVFAIVRALGTPLSVAVAITLTFVLAIALTASPRIREWQLTAPIRIYPIGQQKGRIEEI